MAALEPGDDPFVTALEGALAPVAVLVPELHLAAAGAVKEHFAVVLAELLPGCGDVEPEGVGHRLEQPVEVHPPRARPGHDRPVCDAA